MVSLDLTNKLSSKDRAALKRVDKDISLEAKKSFKSLLELIPKRIPAKDRRLIRLWLFEGYTQGDALKAAHPKTNSWTSDSRKVHAHTLITKHLTGVCRYLIETGQGDKLESLRQTLAEQKYMDLVINGSEKVQASLTKAQLFQQAGKVIEKPMAMVNIGQVFITTGKVEHPPLEGQVINVPVEEIEKRNDMGESEK